MDWNIVDRMMGIRFVFETMSSYRLKTFNLEFTREMGWIFQITLSRFWQIFPSIYSLDQHTCSYFCCHVTVIFSRALPLAEKTILIDIIIVNIEIMKLNHKKLFLNINPLMPLVWC